MRRYGCPPIRDPTHIILQKTQVRIEIGSIVWKRIDGRRLYPLEQYAGKRAVTRREPRRIRLEFHHERHDIHAGWCLPVGWYTQSGE